jgi:hypothetical protein
MAVFTGLGSAASPSITFSADTNTGIFSPGADQLAISTNGTGRLFVDASGRVLRGTSNSSTVDSIVIQGNSSFSTGEAYLRLRRNVNNPLNGNPLGQITFESEENSGASINAFTSANWTSGTSHPAHLTFSTTPSGSTTLQERMRLDSSGRLGLGTSSPAVNLHVNSAGNTELEISSTFANSQTTGLRINTTGDSSAGRLSFLKAGTVRGIIKFVHNATAASEALGFNVAGGSDKLVITGTGNVGIGTTSPSSLLHLADAGDITVGTTTGTKIGTATTQKIGFYNATPVVQPTAVANATDAGSVIARLNDLLTRMRNLGLIAT